ncbi:hypothetical protein [Streptomyces malaysiensis]|uniref:hypothetical protein n=1 Tax=Streptomyces malaysiensis TaxID=92644 RepID=UPI0011CDEC12|nr:hypothetical protein [Streptomyces malaysiensis]
MSAFTVAAAIAALDGADWLPPALHWEIATTDGVWGAHCEIAADTVSEAYRLLCSIASAHDSEVGDNGHLLTVDFVYDEVPVRAWWLRPVTRYVVPEQCATCPTKLSGAGVSFVRLGAGREAPVVCVPCRDRMHARWVGGDAARDAEVLREAAGAADRLTREGSANVTTTLESAWYDGADAAVQLLRRMADEAGKVTRKGEITQPADTTPLVVRWDRTVALPDGPDDDTIVCCLAEDGRPVALFLPDEELGLLAEQLADGDDAQALLAEIWRHGGEITTSHAHRWLRARSGASTPRAYARTLLRRLAERGRLVVREERGRRTYALNHAGGERR